MFRVKGFCWYWMVCLRWKFLLALMDGTTGDDLLRLRNECFRFGLFCGCLWNGKLLHVLIVSSIHYFVEYTNILFSLPEHNRIIYFLQYNQKHFSLTFQFLSTFVSLMVHLYLNEP